MILLLVPTAVAWDSHCYEDDGFANTTCKDAYSNARSVWIGGSYHEHAQIWKKAREMAGLPAELDEDFQLDTYSEGEDIVSEKSAIEYVGLTPVLIQPSHKGSRITSIPAMTQLPDFSYSLWDWVTGNEHCPPEDSWNTEACHDYATHQGPLNSSHFLPQAQEYWDYYHSLALQRAETCGELADDLGDDSERLEDWLLACEQEAMVLEAIAQHFLQDAFSMGHTWARWGSVEAEDFQDSMADGLVLAAIAGMVHGSKSVMQIHPVLGSWDDPMCAPPPAGQNVEWVDPLTGDNTHAIGDLFLESQMWGEGGYEVQEEAMLACSVNSMREVYEKTGQVHDELQPADSSLPLSDRDPSTDACWGQLATNESVLTGWGLHQGQWPDTAHETNEALIANLMWPALLSTAYVGYDHYQEKTVPTKLDKFAITLHLLEISAVGAKIAWYGTTDEHGTKVASGEDLPSLLGMEPNDAYVHGTIGNQASTKLATSADPPLPWSHDSEELDERSLALGFADAHAAERCESMTRVELLNYQADAGDSYDLKSDDFPALCGICAQMVEPHLRLGEDADDYDTDNEPLCGVVAEDAEFVYSDETGLYLQDVTELSRAALNWCGCGWDDGLVLSGFDAAWYAFDGTTGAELGTCPAGVDDPDLGPTWRNDIEPVMGLVDGFAVAYPWLDEIRFFGDTCDADDETSVFLDGDEGPWAMAITSDLQHLVVGTRNPDEPCDPGTLQAIDLDTHEVVGAISTAQGVADIAVVDDGLYVMATLYGGDGCSSGIINSVVTNQLTAGTAVIDNTSAGGTCLNDPGRIDATPDGNWVAWTAGGSCGRVNLRRHAGELVDFVLESDVGTDWDTPTDVAIIQDSETLFRVLVLTEWVSEGRCSDNTNLCGSLRLLTVDGSTGGYVVGNEMALKHMAPNGVAVNEDGTRAYVTFAGSSEVQVFDVTSGLSKAGTLKSGPYPSAIWLAE